jgi:predicted Zn-dependent protease with MMP-like domain
MTGPDGFSWTENLALAEAEVSRLLSQLPAPLRERARTIPVCFAERPTRAQQADGIDADLLGLFVGLPFPEAESGAVDVPPQIYLFLRNLWDEVDGDIDTLRDEIRTTYLHELGHYLGLEEEDLWARDLE